MAFILHGHAPLLQVFDMPVSLAFYRDVLGFEVVQQAPDNGDDCDWAMLQRDGIQLMLNTAYEKPFRPAQPDPVRQAHHADTALYFGCPDIDAAYEQLCALGLHPQLPSVAPYGMKQLYLTDPDGYNLCFQWPAG